MDPEIKAVAMTIARGIATQMNIGAEYREEFVENLWPGYINIAKDVLILLLGDEYPLDEEDYDQKPTSKPLAVHSGGGRPTGISTD